MSRLVKQSIVYLLATLANSAVPFFLLPILTRYLTPADYGLVVMFQLVVVVLTVVVTLSLDGAVSVQYFKAQVDAIPVYTGTCIMIMGLIAAAMLPFICFFESQLSRSLQIAPAWLYLGLASALAAGFSSVRLVLWQAPGKPLPFALFQFGQVSVNALLSIVLVVSLGLGAKGRLLGLAITAIGFGGYALLSLRVSGLLDISWQKTSALSAARFGIPLLPHALAGIAITQADRIIIGQQFGLAEAAIYAVSLQLAMPVIMLVDAFNKAYAPWLFRSLKLARYDVVVALSFLVSIFAALAVVLYVVSALWLIPWFVGERFAKAASILPWLAVGIAGNAIYYMVVNPVFYAERTEILSVVTLSGAVLYVALGWFASAQWGVKGLAATYSVVCFARTLAVFLLSRRVMPLPWFSGSCIANGVRELFSAKIIRTGGG